MARKLKRKVKPKLKTKRPPFRPVADAGWWAARFHDAGMSQNDVARELRMHAGQLSKVFSGRNRMGPENWIKLASLFRVPLVTALKRGGYKVPEQRTQVEGLILENSRISYGIEKQDTVLAAEGDDHEMRALVFSVDKGPLVGFAGMALHYRPSGKVEVEAYGRTSVIQVEGEPTPVVGVLQRPRGEKLRVTLLNGEVIEGRRVLSAAPAERIAKRD